jgi:transposase
MTDSIAETIGCDLGDKSSSLFIIGDKGESRPNPVPTTKADLRKFFTRAPAHVVIETGTHSRWVSQLLKDLGHRVTVANPRRLKLISQSDSKSDWKDPELLARLGRADVELLAPITHRADHVQADLAVAKARDALVRCRTLLVNQVRGLTKSFGERLPKCSAHAFAKKCANLVPEQLAPALDPIFSALRSLEEEIKRHDKTVQRIAKRYPDVQVISQPNGVGVLTALIFLLTLEDKTRFTKSRQVGAFIGVRPRRDQSGDSDKQLRITKAGDPMLRRLLVGSANYILGPFGKDSDLRRWGMRLASQGGKNGRKRAKVAVARKLAVLMHRLWVTGEEYQPLGYRTKAAA